MSQRSRFFDSVGVPITLATSAAADGIIDTAATHGLQAGQQVVFTALTGGAGLTVGAVYFVLAANLAATTFQVSTTLGGAAVNFTTDITAGTASTGDRVYPSEAWAQVVAGVMGDGVVSGGNELAVSENSPTGMSVRVNTGKAFVQGYFFEVYAAQEVVTIAAAHASLARIDRVVVRRDLSNRTSVLAVLAGTPSSSPVAPALTQNAAGVWEIPLAQVFVGASVSVILNANVTDERGARAQGTDITAILAGTGAHAHDGVAGGGTKINWANILSKPAVFAVEDHDHIGTGATHGGSIAWTSIINKPGLFAPGDHGHSASGAGGIVGHGVLAGVTADQHHAQSHTHDGVDGSGTIAWTAITGKPATFAPTNHAATHAIGGSDLLPADAIDAWATASAGGGAAGVKLWVGTTTPSSGVVEGDVWIKK